MSDYSKMNVSELREELEDRGLSPKGRKPQLVARLSAGDGGHKAKKRKVSKSTKPSRKRKPVVDQDENPPKATRTSRRQADKRAAYVDPNENDLDLEWHYAEDGDPTFKYMTSSQIKGSSLVAAYDYDWTIGTPRSGKFAQGRNDRVWWDECVPSHLKKLHGAGYKIVFFTNQAGIEKHKTSFDVLGGKFIDICKELDIPIQVFISGSTNHWRKPHTTMWDYMVEKCNDGVEVDLVKSVYVGDAAGRDKGWAPGKKKDFSVSDRKFAANIGIRFETPEEHFQGGKPGPFKWRSVDPVKEMNPDEYGDTKECDASSIASDEQEVIVFCGFPSAGKSTFAQKYLIPNGYVWVNRDTLKTPAKCIKATQAALSAGKSAVVDNTSPSASDRARYLDVAKQNGVPCRCFWFQVRRELCEHLNFIREKQTNGERRRVPPVGFNMFKSRFREPQKNEGFSEIVNVNFVPSFENDRDEKIFRLWS